MSRFILSIIIIFSFIGCGGRNAIQVPVEGYFTPGLRPITQEEKQAFSNALLKYSQEKAQKGESYARNRLGYSLRKFYTYNPAAAKLYIDKNIARYDAYLSYSGKVDEQMLASYKNTAFMTLLKDKQFKYLDNLWAMLNSSIASRRPNLTLALSTDDWLVHNNSKYSYGSASRLSNYYGDGCKKIYKIDNTERLNTTWGNCKPDRMKENYYFKKMLEEKGNIGTNIEFALSKADHYFKYKKNNIAIWWYAAAADMTNHLIKNKNKNDKYILKEEHLVEYLEAPRIERLSKDINLYIASARFSNIRRNNTLISNLKILVEAGISQLSNVYSQKPSNLTNKSSL